MSTREPQQRYKEESCRLCAICREPSLLSSSSDEDKDSYKQLIKAKVDQTSKHEIYIYIYTYIYIWRASIVTRNQEEFSLGHLSSNLTKVSSKVKEWGIVNPRCT